MPHPRLITFTGIDGSGKSTQIEKLRQSFEEQGRRVVCLWSRGGYTPGVEHIKKALRLLLGRRLPVSGDIRGRSAYFKIGIVRRFWIWIALLDLIRVYAVSVRLRCLMGYTVICDRYLWDTLIDLKILFPQEDVARWFLWKTMKGVAPRPDVAFLTRVPLAVSQERSAAKGDRHVEAEIDVSIRHRLYEELSHLDYFLVIDGTRPVEDVSSFVLEAVGHQKRGERNRIFDVTA